MKISVIIPFISELEQLEQLLNELQTWRQAGHELIAVGAAGEPDDSLPAGKLAELVDQLPIAPRGRALQMNAGTRMAGGDILLFLHVDTRLPENAIKLISEAMADEAVVWGRFDVRLSGQPVIFRIIERAISIRSHLTGIVTGDQALFVRRSTFESLQGYAAIPLMEDVEISKRLKRISWPVRIRESVVTSSRRWERQGVMRTVLLMWWLRLRYFLGDSPENLERIYYK